MEARIFKRLGVFFVTVVIFVTVIAPCLDLGERDVYAASSYTYTSMVRKSISLGKVKVEGEGEEEDVEIEKTLDYYLVEPTASGKYDVVVLFSGLYGVGAFESSFLYYASKWMATKKIKPVVFVIPILEKFGHNKYFKNFVDEEINGTTRMKYLLDIIRDGSISAKADPKTDITVAGYSMGGCAALYAGIRYKDIIKNVGGLSPSYRTFTGDTKGCVLDPEELVFSEEPDRHLFICASKKEKKGSMYKNMQLYLENFKTPFVTRTYSKGGHTMTLFQKEIFTFLYYVQNDQLPSGSIVKAMNKKKMKSKFVTVNGKKYFILKNGTRAKGWKKIKGKHYYFSKKTRVMKTGWLTLKKKKYYLSYRGRRYHGWHTIDGKTYYFNKKTGVMAKNMKIGEYYVGSDGARE